MGDDQQESDPQEIHSGSITGELDTVADAPKEVVSVAHDYSDISLRLLDLSDADDFMEWFTDEKVAKFCSWDCFVSKEDAINYVADFVIPHPWYRAICLKNKPIGSISVWPFRGKDRCRAEIGYVLGSKYWGNGIATKAVKMATSFVFLEWPHLERLEGLVDVENVGSQRVLEKAGFTREGVLRKYCLLKGKIPRDMIMFSILSTDPQVNYFICD
ncbi:OLC1v1020005C1 [Oldenlandia corymbosa var. corymbosa]|uniref:OLC1v1020005C1 n=1 Tax=Oldenlandia corymbosa var. corymbosa TaxID=529605 RepID=A0AAV1EFI4_OLDCO|nr:OLC1v1020005C1 [Oldenlandia corymbosa var. corymbosa]